VSDDAGRGVGGSAPTPVIIGTVIPCSSKSKAGLSKGVQGFSISGARQINKANEADAGGASLQGFSISGARQINKAITARGGHRRTGRVIGVPGS
jgi:hypothetical protein